MTTKELWRDIPTLPEGYQASNFGRIRSWRRPGKAKNRFRDVPLIRKAVVNSRGGYLTLMFVIGGKYVCRYVHQLVLEAFRGKKKGPEVRHLNGNPCDNRISNLVWGTRVENVSDQIRHGTFSCGEKNGMAKLTKEEAVLIRNIREKGCKLSRKYGVSQATVSRIRHGVRYAS